MLEVERVQPLLFDFASMASHGQRHVSRFPVTPACAAPQLMPLEPCHAACASQGITFATAYDSLGEEGLRHSINEPESTGVFTNANLLGTLAAVVSSTPSLTFVVYDGDDADIPSGALDTIRAANGGIQVLNFDDFLKSGKENPVEPNRPNPDDILAIMYTSGASSEAVPFLLRMVTDLGSFRLQVRLERPRES